MKELFAWLIVIDAALIRHRVERASGGDESAPVRPGDEIHGLPFGLVRRIRHREDDGAFDVLRHLTHDRFRERLRLARSADQDRGLHRADDGQEIPRRALLEAHLRRESRRPCEVPLVDVLDLLVVHDETLAVEVRDGASQGLARETRAPERVAQQPGDADAGGACSENHDALVLERNSRRPAAGHDSGHGHGRGSLDVVVEAGDDLPIAVQQAEGVDLLEVLPLQESLREALLHGLDELLDQRVVLGAAQAWKPPAEVELVLQERFVVRADVEADGQRLRRVDARGRRVERQLADRNPHASRTLVAETEDALVVRHDDEADVVERGVAEDLVDPPAVCGRDPEPAGPAEDVAELLARPAQPSGV